MNCGIGLIPRHFFSSCYVKNFCSIGQVGFEKLIFFYKKGHMIFHFSPTLCLTTLQTSIYAGYDSPGQERSDI